MLLFFQIAGGTALGLLIALIIVEYFEEIVLTSILFLGLGIPMIWVLTYLEGSGSFLQKLVNVFRPLLPA
ncbi:MAG: hypothetical protein H6624_18100 [Bdellovibrionaceae bacterium]|nr:hypothetical protein [Bdellovibrionales bacterium]MCB9086258.1 hypothetical protein [Pseudobdellovibrionaceae bacterium]